MDRKSEYEKNKQSFSFSKNEEDILKFWEEEDIYKKLIEKNKNGPIFRFMDGPPFVSSKNLHYGHIHVGYIKDCILRFKRMNGYNVLNKIGYDCHGLPIEQVVDKILNIHTKKEVEKFGIANYNNECKKVIQSFSGEWKGIYNRIGRWVDFSNEYKTLDTNYMETVWWVFNQLWNKDLVYRGYKIMAFSTACATAISNFEAKQNYKDVVDMSIFVKFKLKDSGEYLVVWTTTPWTLPSNLALCVNPKINYVYLQDKLDNNIYIVAEGTVNTVYPIPKKNKDYVQPYEIIKTIEGSELKDKEYEPMFDYFKESEFHKGFKIITASFVTDTDGTGIVHLAPAYGEDDLNACIENNILSIEDVGNFSPIDDNGYFTNEVYDFKCEHYKIANDKIIQKLKDEGKLIRKEPYRHNYPFCWRTDTPLMYRAVSGFFIKVTAIKDKLIKNNKKTNWTPEHIGEKRFHNWLENTKDWGVSRSRFFGTPIPVWVSEDGEEMVSVGSIDELVELANLKERPTDLHREFIDSIEIPSKQGKGVLKRVEAVFDCWFESGSVPYAQIHYPFENKELIDDADYMSDFICEGLDQTRGWFYTLLVLSTALFDKPAFKNVICSGLICGDDGTKLSKRYGNYTAPDEIFKKYSSDVVRLYLISSPAARAGSFKFDEKYIFIVMKKFIQWYNGYKFYIEQVVTCNHLDIYAYVKSNNIIDKWILTRLINVANNISQNIEDYEVYKVYPQIADFIEDLTNWYIKLNRNRLKGKNCSIEDQNCALSTLWNVLIIFSKITAPFTPFLSETFYRGLTVDDDKEKSVHHCAYPKQDDLNITPDVNIERKMKFLQAVACTVRSLRNKTTTAKSMKVSLQSVTIATDDELLLKDLKELEIYMLEEVNVLEIKYTSTKDLVKYKVVANRKNIGQKFKNKSGVIIKKINDFNQETLMNFYNKNLDKISVTLNNQEYYLNSNDMSVAVELNCKLDKDEFASVETQANSQYIVIINSEYNETVKSLYKKKLFVRSVQEMRKSTDLHPWDDISIYYETDNEELLNILNKYNDSIVGDLLYKIYPMDELNTEKNKIIDKDCDIDGVNIRIVISKN